MPITEPQKSGEQRGKLDSLVGHACERCNGDGYYMCEYRMIDVPCPDCQGLDYRMLPRGVVKVDHNSEENVVIRIESSKWVV